ncbi:MAG: heme ABC transporter ATP-binding protein [Pseudomonadota bacterium]
MSLALNKASVIRSGRRILDSADLHCASGRVTAFVGPNGAGKSTALSLLVGTLKPDEGEAEFEGKQLSAFSAPDLARRRAFVPQSPMLTFPFQVHEVVAMGRTPFYGSPRARHDESIQAEVMGLLDVASLAERNYLTLSGGERQRVNIARALAQLWDHEADGHPWLLLDEPTSALDLKYQLRLMEVLQGLAARHWGIVVVLHDLLLAQEYAQDVVLFRDGRVFGAGTQDELLTPDTVQEVFDLEAPYDWLAAKAAALERSPSPR